jgi:hypothetical protein
MQVIEIFYYFSVDGVFHRDPPPPPNRYRKNIG